MKKILASLTAIAAVAAFAAPASAQHYRGYNGGGYNGGGYNGGGYNGQTPTAYTDSFDWQIDNSARQGRISGGEARQLHAELQEVKPIAWRVQTGEASGRERQRLDSTLGRIRSEINGGGRGGNSYYYNRGGDYGANCQRGWAGHWVCRR